jgi:hypothetical protein
MSARLIDVIAFVRNVVVARGRRHRNAPTQRNGRLTRASKVSTVDPFRRQGFRRGASAIEQFEP